MHRYFINRIPSGSVVRVMNLEKNKLKFRKGFGYSLSTKLWMCQHFKFKKGAFIPIQEIIEMYRSRNMGKETRERTIGRVVSDIWGKKGVRRKRIRKRGEKVVPGYFNLAVRIDENENYNEEKTCDELVAELQTSVENWVVVRNNKNSFSVLKNETITFNNQRSSVEILVVQESNGDFQLHLVRQQFRTTIERLKLDEELKGLNTINQIKLLAHFLDTSSFCCGFQVPVVTNRFWLKKSFEASVECIVGSIGQATTECRMFSVKCSIIAPEGQCCPACTAAKRIEENKEKRIIVDDNPIRPGVNDRYLSEEGMIQKLAEQRKKLKSCHTRENRLKNKLREQSLEMEDEDHEDL